MADNDHETRISIDERRSSERRLEEQNREVRLSVAESKLNMHGVMLESNQELTARLVDRLDLHIQESTRRDEDIRSELANVTVAITANNAAVISLTHVVADATDAIKEVSTLSRNNQIDLIKIDTARHTLAKIGGILVIVCSAIWGVATYVIDHTESKPTVIKK